MFEVYLFNCFWIDGKWVYLLVSFYERDVVGLINSLFFVFGKEEVEG